MVFEISYDRKKGPSAIPGTLWVGGISYGKEAKSRKVHVREDLAVQFERLVGKAPGWSCTQVPTTIATVVAAAAALHQERSHEDGKKELKPKKKEKA